MKLNNFDEDLKVEKSYDKFMKFTKKKVVPKFFKNNF